jgi:hypothetical protein
VPPTRTTAVTDDTEGLPQHRERTKGSLAPDHGGCNRFPVRQTEHEGNGVAMGKVDMVALISPLRYHGILFKRYLPEMRREQCEVFRRQCS